VEEQQQWQQQLTASVQQQLLAWLQAVVGRVAGGGHCNHAYSLGRA
jgi:hypothetical protein